jgi:hypothetical protein
MGDGPNGQSRIVDRLAVWSVTQVRAITRAAAKFRPPALRGHWAVFEHAVLGRPFFLTCGRVEVAAAIMRLATGSPPCQVERHIRYLAPLAFVSPRIIEAIANGNAPADLTVSTLADPTFFSACSKFRT